MKKIILLSIVFTLFSCEDIQFNNNLEDLNTDSLEQFVPVEILDSHNKIIFINSSGQEMEFIIEIFNEIESKEINGRKYDREIKSYVFETMESADFILSIDMLVDYYDEKTEQKDIICSLYTSANNGWIPSIRLNESGNALSGTREDLTLGSKEFKDVFSNNSLNSLGYDFKYSKIFYNYEFGFVGFHDADNQLWSLDRYEN